MEHLPPKWTEKTVKVADLRPYERNPRQITPQAYERLKSAIQRLGYHQRVICQPDMRVIGGHQRLKAFKELGIVEIAVLIPNRELTTEEFRQLLVQDNLPFGDFDFQLLAADFKIEELKDWGMPQDWLNKAKPPLDDEKAEDTPPIQELVVSAPGDVWILGGHRVMCGDSTSAADVSRLLNGNKPNLMVTDPPYGVEYDPDRRNRAVRADGSRVAARAVGVVQNDHRADWREAWALFPGNIAYVWHAGLFSGLVAESLEATQFKLRSQIIWAKSNFAIGRGDYHWQHEPCWYAVREKGDWHGDRKQTTIWNIGKPQKSETGHSTQKPIECMRRPMLNNSSEGCAVYDPFLGSGTSIIAAEQSNRVCYGLEISPAYVDLICRRYIQFCGKPVTLEGDGRTFAEIEKSRN